MAENYYLNIADLSLCLSNSNMAQINSLMSGLDNFQMDSLSHVDIQVELNSDFDCTDIQSANVISSFVVDNIEYTLLRFENLYFFKLFDIELEETYLLKYEFGTQTVYVNACENPQHFRFLIWMSLALAGLQYGAFFIHSSAVVHEDKAVLFLGESGRGKSTQSRLWIEHISNTELINDDSPILRISGNKLMLYGSPWSGKVPCYRNIKQELKAFVRIERASANEIVELDTLKSIAALYPSLPPMFAHDEALADMMLEFVSQVLSIAPLYTLKCLPTAEAAIITHQKLYGEDS